MDICEGYIGGEDLMKLSKEYNPVAKVISFSGYNDRPKFADRILQKPTSLKDLQKIVDYINCDNIK